MSKQQEETSDEVKLFTPFANRVLVKLELEEVSGDIVIPEGFERSLEKALGEVVEVGPDCIYCKKGMRVMVSKYAGLEVQIYGESYRVIHEDDIAGEFHDKAVSLKTEQKLT